MEENSGAHVEYPDMPTVDTLLGGDLLCASDWCATACILNVSDTGGM